jgi:hypothetical protein
MSAKIKYAAQLSHVREVSLRGTADLEYWAERLRGEKLVPTEERGRAQILVIAADSKFMGIRFTELSFSVFATAMNGHATNGSGGEGAYLLRAFNSVRFFAFCERALFKTPYYHGTTRVQAEVPAAVELTVGGRVVYRAAMQASGGASQRAPAQSGPGGWSGPIYLPGRERLFFATISGHTETYPFGANDTLLLQPSPESQVLQALVDSHFQPCEWSLRGDASHAKSKTYRREDAAALAAGASG